MGRDTKRRPAEQRSVDNALYAARQQIAGIVRTVAMIPAVRLPELKALTLAWRREAKLLLESDLPSAEQILQIHGVSRTLRLPLPIKAFETRAAADKWLLDQEPALAHERVYLPRVRVRPGRRK